jgi:IS30 family transposase
MPGVETYLHRVAGVNEASSASRSIRAVTAEQTAAAGRPQPKLYAVDRPPRLQAVVIELLKGGWSPASIAGRLPRDYRDDQAVRVSPGGSAPDRVPAH